MSLGLSLRANLIQMDVRESDLSADELRAMLSAYRRRKRFHRMSDGRIAALGEGDVAALGDMMRDLGVSADELLDGGAELPTYQAFYLDREYGDAVRNAPSKITFAAWTVRASLWRRPHLSRVRCGPTR
ncbi:MAG: SNF2 helicase associated domain-containing protein [Adlercreutzia equolifaciens]